MMKKPPSCSLASANGPSCTWPLAAVQPDRRRDVGRLQAGAGDDDAGIVQRLHVGNEARPEGFVLLRDRCGRRTRRGFDRREGRIAWLVPFDCWSALSSLDAMSGEPRAFGHRPTDFLRSAACSRELARPSPAPRCRTRSPCRRSNRNLRRASTARRQPGRDRQRAMVEPGARVADGLAGIDRLQPFEVAEAGRRAEFGCRSWRRPTRRPAASAMLHRIHADGRVPARCAEPAEHALLRRFLVDMEGLRVVFAGERLDRLRRRMCSCRYRRPRRGGRTCRGSLRCLAGRGTCRCSAARTPVRRAGW